MKIILLFIGIIIGVASTFLVLNQAGASSGNSSEDVKKEPAYWVAPMDANYRRDKPGKSPMGMDLIPFYEDEEMGLTEGVGTVRISPAVINNLGVRTAKVERKSLHSKINTVGYVNFDEDQLIHIHPRVKGWIEKLYVKASGEAIKKGDPLYDIYSPQMVNAQEELLIALQRKNVRLIEAAKNRLLSLHVPKSAIKTLERTKKVKQTITFYSPQSGVIDNLKIRQGFYVSLGTTLMSIGTLKQVWVNAEVFEREASFLEIGSKVEMTLDYLPGNSWNGKVDYIYPTVDSKTRTIKVRLRFENTNELLKPGMFAQVLIHGTPSKETLIVPKEAIIRTGNSKRVVLALGEGKFKSLDVKVGRITDTYAQILSTLKEGERVVTSAQFLLDSESSKTSDFKRMSEVEEENEEDKKSSEDMQVQWVKASVVKLMKEDNTIKVNHDAIPAWKWPSMIMNFEVSKDIDFSMFKENMSLDLEVTKTKDNGYMITNTKMKASNPKEWVKAKVVALMPDDNAIKVNHEAIPAWKWPSMIMNFGVSKDIDFSTFKKDLSLDIEIVKSEEGGYIITNIRNIGNK